MKAFCILTHISCSALFLFDVVIDSLAEVHFWDGLVTFAVQIYLDCVRMQLNVHCFELPMM